MEKNLKTILSYTKPNGECLEWTRCFNTDGYPRALIDGNSNAKVHRVVYSLVKGDIPNGLVIRHDCDNPKCINPDHLRVGTNLDNIQDRNKRSGNGKAKLTKEQVIAIRQLDNRMLRKDIAKLFNIDARTVSSILLNKHWKHVT